MVSCAEEKVQDLDQEAWQKNREGLVAPVLEKLAQGEHSVDPYAARNGISILRADEQGAEGVLTVTPAVLNPYGTVHGGCLVALADSVAGYSLAAAGRLCVTQGSTVNFLRPAIGKVIHCQAKPQKVGREICVVSVEQTDEEGRLLTTALFTFCVMKEIPPRTIRIAREANTP